MITESFDKYNNNIIWRRWTDGLICSGSSSSIIENLVIFCIFGGVTMKKRISVNGCESTYQLNCEEKFSFFSPCTSFEDQHKSSDRVDDADENRRSRNFYTRSNRMSLPAVNPFQAQIKLQPQSQQQRRILATRRITINNSENLKNTMPRTQGQVRKSFSVNTVI